MTEESRAREEKKYDYTVKHAGRICTHYVHAREKHPYFCDRLLPGEEYRGNVGEEIKANLAEERLRITYAIRKRRLGWDRLLNCEVWEALEAVFEGNKARAVEELYDCIAVILRTIDVLEGRQTLGRPEEGGSEK